MDIAVLLLHEQARRQPQLMLTPCHYALTGTLATRVDLLNAREVSTVFQKEIIEAGRPLYCADDEALAEFEITTLSHYQKLKKSRKKL
ncbi:MAG: hypothetical protein EXQ52_11115 [Bryobacterales bacterium]|nr:hypothetical protein [Bryobacterales bacterium]